MLKNNPIRLVMIFVLLAVLIIEAMLISYFYKEPFKSEPNKQKVASPVSSTTENKTESPKITMPKVIYNLSGVIQKIEQNSVVLEANISYIDETNQVAQKKETKKIIITPATKFSRLTITATAQENTKKIQENEMAAEDLKVGDNIEAIAASNINNVQEFEATQIRILP
ncbi:hypothetical protein KJ586_01695 [Patescibacteria group bacterium]|nr:hypothetical protein [Patescibacteria group bacterium]